MNLRNIFCGIAMAGVLLIPVEQVFPQDKSKGGEKAPAITEEMMKKWAEAGTPGDPHKVLDQFVGKWDISTRMWFEGPAKPPMEVKATAEIKWILDGRFVQEDATCQMMGMSQKSIGVTGYDNLKKKYVITYMDNTSTAIYTGEGMLDESGKVMTLFGKFDEPMTGERDKVIKFVTRLIGPDKHIFEIYDLVGTPSEFKSLEMTYVRRR